MRGRFFSLFLIFFIFDRLIKNILLIKGDFLFFKFIPNSYFLFFFKRNIFYLLILIVFFLLVFFLIKSFKNREFFIFNFLFLIFLGGFSNFLDRFLYGFVIDYFNFFSLFSFNFSDIMIFIGTIFLIFKLLFGQKHVGESDFRSNNWS